MSIYKRGKVYYGDLYQDGQRVRVPLDTDKQLANTKYLRLKEQSSAAKFNRPARGAGWEEFKAVYLAWARAEKSPRTIKLETAAISQLEEFHPISKVEQVTPNLLDDFKAHLKNAGKVLPATINRRVRAIKAIMKMAERKHFAPVQNWREVSRYKEPKGKLHFFTAPEVKRIISYCKPPWLTVCLLGARAGLRRAEIHTLTWADIDFKAGRVHISPKEGWMPKDNERRYIPMADDLKAHLRAARASSRGSYVVMGEDGARITIDGLTTGFRDRVHRAGLTGGIHTLRHTFASHLAQAGVPLYSISKMLGHSSITTTEIYAHLCPDVMDTAIKALPKL
jgi:integrase